MDNQPLVQVIELRLHGWAVGLLLLAAVFRLSWGYLSTQMLWLNECQLFTISLALVCLLLGGCFVPLPWSYLVSYLGGGFAWLVALSLIPPTLWSQYAAGRLDLPDWQVIAAVLFALASFILRFMFQRRWRRELSGHSFKWMLDWAKDKPFYARITAMNAMASLGYRI